MEIEGLVMNFSSHKLNKGGIMKILRYTGGIFKDF